MNVETGPTGPVASQVVPAGLMKTNRNPKLERNMKNLSKADIERRDDLASKLREGWSSLEDAYAQVTSAISDFNVERERYNEIVAEAQGFAEDIASQIEGYMDERSDKWREGDRGQEYEAWLSVWQGDLAFDEVEELEEPGMPDGGDLADTLEQAPEAPE